MCDGWLRPCAVLAGLLLGPGLAAQAQGVEFSGHYKNLLIGSRTLQDERYTLDLNRLRLELKANPVPQVATELQYDHELLLGDYLGTGQFRQQKDSPSPQYWKAEANYVDRSRIYGRHRLHRATATLSAGDTDLRLGRQRIAWGTGRFWSPLDRLNPVSPVAIEREERLGVDAVLLEHKLGPVSRVSALYAPQHEARSSSRALLWHGNMRGTDFTVIGGRVQGEELLGGDLAGDIGSTGVRVEATLNRRIGGGHFRRWLLGADHAYANTLSLSAELYHDGGGAPDPLAYDVAAFVSGRVQSLGRRHAGLQARYELTPLWVWNGWAAYNFSDNSRFIAFSLTWSVRPNLDLAFGVQRYAGSARSEYGQLKDLVYVSLQRFF